VAHRQKTPTCAHGANKNVFKKCRKTASVTFRFQTDGVWWTVPCSRIGNGKSPAAVSAELVLWYVEKILASGKQMLMGGKWQTVVGLHDLG